MTLTPAKGSPLFSCSRKRSPLKWDGEADGSSAWCRARGCGVWMGQRAQRLIVRPKEKYVDQLTRMRPSAREQTRSVT
jgi:hypothetical protein